MRYCVTVTVDLDADNAKEALAAAMEAINESSELDAGVTVAYTVETVNEDEEDEDG